MRRTGTIRRESTREENPELFSRYNMKARTVVGRGEEGPLCDSGSELLLGEGTKVVRG